MNKILIALSLVFLGLSCKHAIPMDDNEVGMPSGPIEYLALGDSYTIGQSVAEEKRYPNILKDRLEASGVTTNDPLIIARTGWTTSQLKFAMLAELTTQKFDLVSLLIGVNNQFQGRTLEEYKIHFDDLLDDAISLADGDQSRVFVISIPDYAYTPFGESSGNSDSISLEIDEFNTANEEITLAKNVSYFNITPISRQGLADSTLVAIDGLHPSGVMYEKWVDLFFDDVLAKFN